jgi:hypothetical protein
VSNCETRLSRLFSGPGDHFRQRYDGESLKNKKQLDLGLVHCAGVDADSILPTAYEDFAGFAQIYYGKIVFNMGRPSEQYDIVMALSV